MLVVLTLHAGKLAMSPAACISGTCRRARASVTLSTPASSSRSLPPLPLSLQPLFFLFTFSSSATPFSRPPHRARCVFCRHALRCRCDEDVEDVFFLDEGANVVAAVSDRSVTRRMLPSACMHCCARALLGGCAACNGVQLHLTLTLTCCCCRGGAVFSDFRSPAEAARAPSIGARRHPPSLRCRLFSGFVHTVSPRRPAARQRTDLTCGDACGTHIALGCSDGTVLVYDHRHLGVSAC
jgi:hypothetical protein